MLTHWEADIVRWLRQCLEEGLIYFVYKNVDTLGYEGIHGGYGFGKRNIDGERIMEFAIAKNLVVGNSKFVKKDINLVGGCSGQVDYILLQCNKFNLVKDIKVIPGEECITQHHLLISNFKLKISKNTENKFVPKLTAWKLKDPSMKEAYVESLNDLLANYRIDNPDNIDDIWKYFKECSFSHRKSLWLVKEGQMETSDMVVG